MAIPHPNQPKPTARVVLLGASNLRLGLSIIMRLALARLGGPLEFYVAHGFGRSYGMWSNIPWRALPGITQCDLWCDVERSPSLPTFAMLTDVGNDLLYGVSPEQLIAWVDECVGRLATFDSKIVVTELPISSILATSVLRYKIFRTIFFPPSRLTFQEACRRAEDTNRRLRLVAESHECETVSMQEAWYGFDPIHLRRRYRFDAWTTVADALFPSPGDQKTSGFSVKRRLSIEFASPSQWRILGLNKSHAQPSAVLNDGSTVAVY